MKHLTIRLISIAGLLCVCCLTSKLHAQVTIGSDKPPVKGAILEIKTQDADNNNVTSTLGGLGLPRVQLVNKTTLEPFIKTSDADWATGSVQDATKKSHVGLTVYNLTSNMSSTSITDSDLRFHQGIYVWDGNRWNFVYEGHGQHYFFIPSANIPLADTLGKKLPDGSTFDLYTNIYKAQFSKTGNSTFVSSNPALNFVPSTLATDLYNASDLDYVITYYDDKVIKVNSISITGVMNYNVLSLDTSPDSFINIVFVIKEDKLK